MKFFLTLSWLMLFILPDVASSKTVTYEYDIDYKTINIAGKDVNALSINDQIPAPTISATVGDTLRVTFHNRLDVETSVHWHGVLLPNAQDGVPRLTTAPIKPYSSHTFEFPITHAGTYWYHSHTGLQEQRGLYGSLVFYPHKNNYYYDHEKVVMLSDWTNESPENVLRHLKREDDYYSLKKDTVQSWDKVIRNGPRAIRNRLNNAWIRMGPMDISDVGYDAFLINGHRHVELEDVNPGDVVRLRIINAGASSYFYVNYSGGPLTLIEVDGMPVSPIKLNRLRLAIAETFDVLITIPTDGRRYEFRATAEDTSGFASLMMGQGETVPAPAIEKPNLFLMDHSMHASMDHGAMNQPDSMEEAIHNGHEMHKHNGSAIEDAGRSIPELETLHEYHGIRSPRPTTLNAGNSSREVRLELTGNMERYVWTFNNKALTEADKILIRKGENVRFVLNNKTMMHHPLHLHGHFFRVLNGEGDYSPLKHTVNVPPFQTVTIEFMANEEKDWFFHCHNLYHMKAGMARVIRYEDNPGNSEDFDDYLKRYGDPWYYFADIGLYSNMLAGKLWAMNLRNSLEVHYDFDWDKNYEVDATYERHLTRFFGVYGGGKFEHNKGESEQTATIGIRYILPMLIKTDLRFDSEGKFRFQLGSELQLTNRTGFKWYWNTDDEYRVILEYEINKAWSVTANYDSDFNGGIGITAHF
ncbi:MAG: multicopper oxidase domain-containing protein [Gammaproteobacteria bacterium]|nr:multicopper oxidase domain-containing protein [Gammaproteobacteria bacterium]NIO61752.1 multicopper oxidase domain-containing protein [Gammaproteobacteria bacterium]NIP48622.1 multicopper oxidase domain-containing protein [Gammaproteobacteria bacterium]NIQ09074.1 multicopper oxidase domain-containing protein [Gammaproteobacteria bacterium]NIQ19003.1 multicopper oxidase domain-containing protein [Gammaproteobacteria bacterium]